MSPIFKNKELSISALFLSACLLFSACGVQQENGAKVSLNVQEANLTASNESTAETGQSESTQGKEVEKAAGTSGKADSSQQVLLSEIPDRDIYLYGKSDGVVLRIGDREQYFDWVYMTPRGILQRMQVGDFDANGKEELCVILYMGSGTGVSVEELHMAEIAGGEEFIDHKFTDYVSQLDASMEFKTFVKAGELMGSITAPDKAYTVSLKEFQSEDYGKVDEKLCFGSIVGFKEGNMKLSAEFGAGITSQAHPVPSYIGKVYADVEYRAGAFSLKNFRFGKYDE